MTESGLGGPERDYGEEALRLQWATMGNGNTTTIQDKLTRLLEGGFGFSRALHLERRGYPRIYPGIIFLGLYKIMQSAASGSTS